MKITAVTTFVLESNRDRPADGRSSHFLVKIETDAGITGWGEAFTAPSLIRAIVEADYKSDRSSGLRALLIGEDPTQTEHLWRRMAEGTLLLGREGVAMHAMAAIDLALWDIKGKALGEPVHVLLGAAQRDRIDWYATSGLGDTIEETTERARQLAARGCRAIKFGWFPSGRTLSRDVATVAAIREAIGPDIRLLVDGGMNWSLDEAMARTRAFAPYDIYWFEEALRAYDIEGYSQLRAASSLKITAGEMAATPEELGRLIDAHAVDVLQIELTQVGLTQAMKVVAHANRKGIPVVNHHYVLDINLAASLHMLAVAEMIDLCETPGLPNDVRDAITRNPPRPGADGLIAVPMGPGLGVDIDEEAVRRFAIEV